MSTVTIPVTHIKGEPLNEAATRYYLSGFFAGLSARGLKFSEVEPLPNLRRQPTLRT